MKRKWYKSPFFIGALSSASGILIVRLLDLANVSFFTKIWDGIIWLITPLSSLVAIPLWLFILIIVSVIVLTVLFIRAAVNRELVKYDAPDFIGYTSDVFNNILYKWDYSNSLDGKYQVVKIELYCPECDCSLVNAKCPNCQKPYARYTQSVETIEALIRHRAEHPEERNNIKVVSE